MSELFGRNMIRYSVGVEDPAWPESGGGVRGADSKYPLMTVAAIVALPISFCMDTDAHYWLWATDNYLEAAFAVLRARGFRYVCSFVWVKTPTVRRVVGRLRFMDLRQFKLQRGMGQYSRKSHEYLLFGSRGAAAVPPPHRRPPSVIFGKRGDHSSKPYEAWEVIDKVSRCGPCVEFNARERRLGWTPVGHEFNITIEQFCQPYRS